MKRCVVTNSRNSFGTLVGPNPDQGKRHILFRKIMRPSVALPARSHHPDLHIVDFHLETPCFQLVNIDSKLRRTEDCMAHITSASNAPYRFSTFFFCSLGITQPMFVRV